MNVLSIVKKAAAVCDILASSNLDVLALQETSHETADSVSRQVTTSSKKRDDRPLLVDLLSVSSTAEACNYSPLEDVVATSNKKTFEFVFSRLNDNRDGDFVVASIYRPGSAVVTREFFTELTTFLKALET